MQMRRRVCHPTISLLDSREHTTLWRWCLLIEESVSSGVAKSPVAAPSSDHSTLASHMPAVDVAVLEGALEDAQWRLQRDAAVRKAAERRVADVERKLSDMEHKLAQSSALVSAGAKQLRAERAEAQAHSTAETGDQNVMQDCETSSNISGMIEAAKSGGCKEVLRLIHEYLSSCLFACH